MKKIIQILLLLPFTVYSQIEHNYTPICSDLLLQTKRINEFTLKNKQIQTDLTSKFKKDLKTIYENRNQEIIDRLKNDEFIFGHLINSNLQTLLDKIYQSNPSIPNHQIQLLLSKSSIPNAYCLGEGTIVINLGLLQFLENESQLAFVICHELAHFQLNHVNISIQNQLEVFASEEVKSTLKSISKNDYLKISRIEEFVRNVSYSKMKNSRKDEIQADSLGMVYLQRTSFQDSEAKKTLEILDIIDNDDFDFDFQKIFNTPSFQFQEKWLKSSQISNFGSFTAKPLSEAVIDSLKTHPDCALRIEKISNNFLVTKKKKSEIISTTDFIKMRESAMFEIVESDFYRENYSKTLYRLIKLLHKYPNNSYLNAMLVRCIYVIHSAKKQHQLYKYIDNEKYIENRNYQSVLRVIENLTLKDLSRLAYYPLKEKPSLNHDDEIIIFASYLASDLIENSVEKENWKKIYQSKYPKGKYESYFF